MRILAEESDAKSSNKEELRKKTSIRLDTLANSSPKRVSREKSLAPANGDAEDFFRMLSISDDLADSRDVALDERRGNGLPPLGTQASTSLDSLDLDVTEEDTNSLMSDVDDLFKTVSSSKARNSKRASKKKSSRAIFDGVSAEKAPSKHLARKDTFYNAVKSFFSSGTDDCEYPEEDYTSVVTIQKIPFKEGDGHFTGSSNLHSGSQNTIVDPYSPSIYRYITGRSSSLSLDTISDKQTLNLKAVDSSSQNTLLRTPSFKGIKPIFSSDRGDSEAELKMLQRQNLQLQTTLKIVVQERDNIETDRTQKRIEIMNYQTLLESLHLDIEALSKELQQAKTAEAIALQQRDEKDIRLRSVLSFIEEKMQSGELRLGLTGGNNRNESVAQDFSVPNLRKAHSFESRASLDKHDARRRSRDSSPTTRAISKKRLQLTSPAIAPLLTPVNDANTINNDKNPVEDWVDDSDFETFVQSHNQEAGVKPAFPSKYSLAYNNVLGGNGYVTDASVGGRLGSNSRVADGSTTNVRPNALSKYNTDQSMQGSKYVLNAAIEPSIKQRSIYSTLHQSDISAKQSKALEGNDQHRNVRHQRKGSDIDQGLQKKIHKVRIIVDDQSNQNNCQNLRFDSQGYEIDQYGIRLADYSH